MTSEEFYTYNPAFETTLYGNKGGGITVEQTCDMGDKQLIVLTTHQARWLADRLLRLAVELDGRPIDADEVEEGES